MKTGVSSLQEDGWFLVDVLVFHYDDRDILSVRFPINRHMVGARKIAYTEHDIDLGHRVVVLIEISIEILSCTIEELPEVPCSVRRFRVKYFSRVYTMLTHQPTARRRPRNVIER